MTYVFCGWCGKKIDGVNAKDKAGDHSLLICSCGRLLPASKKEKTGNLVGRKHVHIDYKNGDIAI